MDRLPLIDKLCIGFSATPEAVWGAIFEVIRAKMNGNIGMAQFLKAVPVKSTIKFNALGDTVPGFEIIEVEANKKLVLKGRHRFSKYQLTFTIESNRLCAQTHARFPGLLGAVYKALVIYSGAHESVTKSLLKQIIMHTKIA